MKNVAILAVIVVLFLIGCSKPREIRQVHVFANESWEKFDTLRFSVVGNKKEEPRDLNLVIRYNAMYALKGLPVTILILSPDGSESVIEKKIWLRNPDETPRGTRFGEASWDYTFCFREAFEFRSAGEYKILIDNKTGKYDNPGVEQVVFEAVPATEREKKAPTANRN